jgi:hypothetical protein
MLKSAVCENCCTFLVSKTSFTLVQPVEVVTNPSKILFCFLLLLRCVPLCSISYLVCHIIVCSKVDTIGNKLAAKFVVFTGK